MSSYKLGYITNGLHDHSLSQAIGLLEKHAYQAIGITLDHQHLDPYKISKTELLKIQAMLSEAKLMPVVECGARYYLDSSRKHHPNLMSTQSEDRQKRLAFYERAIEIAVAIGASTVSLWSGSLIDDCSREEAWARLVPMLNNLLIKAESHNVTLAFEPEPGMFVESISDYFELKQRLNHPSFKMTMDIGHLAVTEECTPLEAMKSCMDEVVNIHIDDIRNREHFHLPLGDGEIDFEPLIGHLKACNYSGALLVELSRNSHEAPAQIQKSIQFLSQLGP